MVLFFASFDFSFLDFKKKFISTSAQGCILGQFYNIVATDLGQTIIWVPKKKSALILKTDFANKMFFGMQNQPEILPSSSHRKV